MSTFKEIALLLIIITTVSEQKVTISKCCNKYEQLDHRSWKCIKMKSRIETSKTEEYFNPPINNKTLFWIPDNIRNEKILVLYNKYPAFGINKVFDTLAFDSENEFTINKVLHKLPGFIWYEKTYCHDSTNDYQRPRVIFMAVTLPHIVKCCYKEEKLDITNKKCVNVKGKQISLIKRERLEHPRDNKTLQWFPEILNNLYNTEFYVFYGMMHDLKENNITYDIGLSLAYDTESFYTTHGFDGKVVDSFVKNEWSCLDTTTNSHRPRVLYTAQSIKTIHKCCNRHQQLNSSLNGCVQLASNDKSIVLKKLTYQTKFPDELKLFETSTKFAYKIDYNFLKRRYQFNQMFKNLQMNYVRDSKDPNTRISFAGYNITKSLISGTTNTFCIDFVTEGNLTNRVVLVALPDIYKCCGKAQQLDSFLKECVPRFDVSGEDVNTEFLDWNNNKSLGNWLPQSLQHSQVFVKYNILYEFKKKKLQVSKLLFNEDEWSVIKGNDNIPTLQGKLTYLSGQLYVYTTTEFCFETIVDGVKVILVNDFRMPELVLPKCCFPGEILSPEGHCETHNGTDWAPSRSEIKEGLPAKITPESNLIFPVKAYCPYQAFEIHSLDNAVLYNIKNGILDSIKTLRCNDFQRSNSGVKEVVGSCYFPRYSIPYVAVRPLGAVAAVLLVAAAVVAVARTETRRSAHGRALICHTLCLAATNATQVTYFFVGDITRGACTEFQYTAYFFMTASNWWLTALSLNMLKNFRKPLGALARTKKASNASKKTWVRFGLMSAFAWGGSGALTAFTITMRLYSLKLNDLGLIAPSFSETRTCGIEFDSVLVLKHQGNRILTYRLGALFYYYVPVTLMTIINGVCVGFTVCRVRQLDKDSAIAQRADSPQAARERAFRNAAMYVKFMLTTGIVELAMEAVAWTLSQRIFLNPAYNFILAIQNNFKFGIAGSILDFFRAVGVFWLCMGPWCGKCIEVSGRTMISAAGRMWGVMNKCCKFTDNDAQQFSVTYRGSKKNETEE